MIMNASMHTTHSQHVHTNRGMTLVETLVISALVAVIMAAVGNATHSFYRYNAYTIAQSYQVDHARRGVDLLVRDLREMTYADDGAFPLVSRATSSVRFYSDIDRDDSVELVEYVLVDETLTRYIYEATGTPPVYPANPTYTETVSEYVQNHLELADMFTYYDENGAILSGTGVADVRFVDIVLVVNVDSIREPGKYHLRSSATLRNLKEYE